MPTKATHILHKQKTQCIYIYAALPLFGATLSALLPRLDDCHNNDHHYHQQYDDGIAHPLSRILLQFLGILESANALLYVIGSVRNLETEEGNWHVSDFHLACHTKTLHGCPIHD